MQFKKKSNKQKQQQKILARDSFKKMSKTLQPKFLKSVLPETGLRAYKLCMVLSSLRISVCLNSMWKGRHSMTFGQMPLSANGGELPSNVQREFCGSRRTRKLLNSDFCLALPLESSMPQMKDKKQIEII